MADFKLTHKAVADLNGIWEYTFDNWSVTQADRYYDLILGKCQEIANNPDCGKNYEGISPYLYGLRAGKHIIFYRRLIHSPIEITRILHQKMDLKSRIDKS